MKTTYLTYDELKALALAHYNEGAEKIGIKPNLFFLNKLLIFKYLRVINRLYAICKTENFHYLTAIHRLNLMAKVI